MPPYGSTHFVYDQFPGKVMDNTKIYIMNVNRELAINLEQGQVCVGGLPLAMSYVNKKTKDFNFINNPYDTTQSKGKK